MGTIAKIRFSFEILAAIVAIAFLLASLISPDWMERAFGFAPDNDDGSVEWGASAIAVAVFFVSAWLARREWRGLGRESAVSP
jgi:hypothetical protein